MKDIVWDKVLSVGVAEIDEDHQKLVTIFNILNHAVAEGESQEYLAAILDELINCTVWHFSHEERLMLKYDYGRSEEHIKDHRDLTDSVRQLQAMLLQGKQSLAEQEIEYLERWLTAHIFTEDMKLGEHLAQVM